MILAPRPYREPRDLEKMLALLSAGRQANTGTYYVHPGDVRWWLFYPDQTEQFPERIFLWEEGDVLLGWVLFSFEDGALDVFVRPDLCGTPEADAMFVWAEEHLTEKVLERGGTELNLMWIFADDRWRLPFLEGRGFKLQHTSAHFSLDLTGPLTPPTLPAGYVARPVAGEAEIIPRATASHGAFVGDKRPFEAYWPRYLTFMQSAAYPHARDTVLVTPTGQVASFAIYWPDPLTRVGLFEPVGTHPAFQKQGWGKALMQHCLCQLQAAGMTIAIVSTPTDNEAALRLYQSVGFQQVNQFIGLTKLIG